MTPPEQSSTRFSGRIEASPDRRAAWPEKGGRTGQGKELKSAWTASRLTELRRSITALRHFNGLWTHAKGGFYHHGRFITLVEVVKHYDRRFSLGLSAQDKADLVEFLKPLAPGKKDGEY